MTDRSLFPQAFAAIAYFLATASLCNAAERPMYVVAESAQEHLCAASTCTVTNTVYRGQVVTVLEVISGWGRVSRYYDSSAEQLDAKSALPPKVARWIKMDLLGDKSPAPLAQPKLDVVLTDKRIQGIPKVGKGGLKVHDVLTLRRYSAKLIAAGTCKAIDYGDKSVSKPNTYYVVCLGENESRSFTAAEAN